MAKAKALFVCVECGFETGKWAGRCGGCGCFNTMEERSAPVSASNRFPSLTVAGRGTVRAVALDDVVSSFDGGRISTGIGELDRVLSGGIVEGSLILLGGEPGIGKSTILLQICRVIGKEKTVLYVSGEESAAQIKIRAQRMDVEAAGLYLLAETSLAALVQAVESLKPGFLIVDSIQTMCHEDLSSAPGSLVQVRECASGLARIAKGLNIPVIIVGHVTKDGAIAGPRVLEHMVDTVLYFEGERRAPYRIIRAVKNRFGATDEIGVFTMEEKGLREIPNPSEYLLSGRPLNVPGSAVTCSVEGSRPILAEVQALVSYTNFGTPRRMAAGMDYNRAVMLMAVLEKRAGLNLSSYDSYVNITGGLRILEPSLDAAVVAAVASSFRNKAVEPQTMVFGEVGLTGEMRAVGMAEKRVAEAGKLGFTQCVLPKENMKNLREPKGMRIYGAANIGVLLELALIDTKE